MRLIAIAVLLTPLFANAEPVKKKSPKASSIRLEDDEDDPKSTSTKRPTPEKFSDPYEMMVPDFVTKTREAAPQPRKIWVQLQDGSTMTGTVISERPDQLYIEAAMGPVAIPRGRIRVIAYDGARKKAILLED